MKKSMEQIKVIGFDLDGTLIDSLPGLASALNATLRDLQLPLAGEKQISHWIGNGSDVLIQRALIWATTSPDPDLFSQARKLFYSHYQTEAESGSILYPKVAETLHTLNQAGYGMSIITNKPKIFIMPILNKLNIANYFSEIISGDDVTTKKPHPAPIYLLLGKIGVLNTEFIFVGDSRNDIQAGKAAGSITIGLTYGYNYGIPIEDSHPDYVLDEFADLLSLLILE